MVIFKYYFKERMYAKIIKLKREVLISSKFIPLSPLGSQQILNGPKSSPFAVLLLDRFETNNDNHIINHFKFNCTILHLF